MRQIRLSIEYEGTNYSGWQSQKSGHTIQDTLQEKLRLITGEDIRLTGASRTDAGVHALEQIAAFSTESRLSLETLARALNAKLPRDIRILQAQDISSHFHPRFSAKAKSYVYLISIGHRTSAFFCNYVWRFPYALDVSQMKKAAGHLLGKHDFSAFRGSGCGAKTTERTIQSLEIEIMQEMKIMTFSLTGNFIRLRIEADAFLRHMVRNIIGTLVLVGRGKLSSDGVREILESRDRTVAGPTAPAGGLFLERIIY